MWPQLHHCVLCRCRQPPTPGVVASWKPLPWLRARLLRHAVLRCCRSGETHDRDAPQADSITSSWRLHHALTCSLLRLLLLLPLRRLCPAWPPASTGCSTDPADCKIPARMPRPLRRGAAIHRWLRRRQCDPRNSRLTSRAWRSSWQGREPLARPGTRARGWARQVGPVSQSTAAAHSTVRSRFAAGLRRAASTRAPRRRPRHPRLLDTLRTASRCSRQPCLGSSNGCAHLQRSSGCWDCGCAITPGSDCPSGPRGA